MLGSFDRTFAVYWLTERVHNATNEFVTDWDGKKSADATYEHAFVHFRAISENDGADAILFEVKHKAVDWIGIFERLFERSIECRIEQNHFGESACIESVDFGNTVSGCANDAYFLASRLGRVGCNLTFDTLDKGIHINLL